MHGVRTFREACGQEEIFDAALSVNGREAADDPKHKPVCFDLEPQCDGMAP